MPSSIIGGRLPNGKYKEVSLDASGRLECSVNAVIASTNVVSKLNLINTTNLASKQLLTDCSAKLSDIDTTAGATATILRPYLIEGNVNTANIKSGVDSLSACCSGSEVQVDIVGGGFDGAITNAHLTELGTAINSAKVDVNIVSGNISGFSTATLQGAGLPSALTGSGNLKVSIEEGSSGDASATNQATMITELGLIKTSLQSLDDIVQGEDASHGNAHKGVMSLAVRQDTQAEFGGDGDYCPMSIDANGDLRVKIDDASKTHLSEIESAVETIEACVSGSELQVDIVGGGFDGAITNAHLTELGGAINSAKVDVNIVSGNISGFATETTLGNAEAHLGTIDTNIANAEAHLGTIDTNIANAETHLGEIEGAVETIEACCGSNKVNVNIVSGNISGFATSTLQGTINTSLGTLETSLTSMESKQDTQITHLSEIEGAVETIEACVSSNKVATINTQNVSEAVWLNNATINAQSLGASLDTTGYTKVRLYGGADQSFLDMGESDLVLMGSLTDGGTYFNLGSTAIITHDIGQSGSASASSPKFIKIFNQSGTDNYALTINAKLTN